MPRLRPLNYLDHFKAEWPYFTSIAKVPNLVITAEGLQVLLSTLLTVKVSFHLNGHPDEFELPTKEQLAVTFETLRHEYEL